MEYKLASNTWDNLEIEAINRVIDSQKFSMSIEVESYEKKFAEFVNSKYAVMVSSGSAANLLMIASLFFTKDKSKRLNRGDEVIVPAVSWSTTYFPLQQYGLKVKFVDIDRETLNFDLKKLDKAITEDTRAIFAVNILGNSNDFKKIKESIGDRNIILLEDNCESLGATYENKSTGTFGLMGTYSSFYSHHIATMEGGCITTDDEELYHILLVIRAHGWTRNLPKVNTITEIHEDDFNEAFRFILPGYNLRPVEMSGAIGIEQLKKLPNFIKQRQFNAKIIFDFFKDLNFVQLQKETGKSSWFGFSIVLKEDSPISRNELIKLFKEKNIECRPIVTGNFLNNKEVLKYFDYELSGSFENAEYIDKNGLFIGNHHVDITKELKYLRDSISQLVCSKK
jgi:dTDP-4-amino-4,6-dideoxygalactose transaminase